MAAPPYGPQHHEPCGWGVTGNDLPPMLDAGGPNMNGDTGLHSWAARRPLGTTFTHDALRWQQSQQKLEAEALQQLVLELCGPWSSGQEVRLSEARLRDRMARTVPSHATVEQRAAAARTRFNVIEREALDERQMPDGARVEGVVGKHYMGKYVSRAVREQMGNEKIALQPMRIKPFEVEADGRNAPSPIDELGEVGSPADWFLEIEPSGLGYVLPERAYGQCLRVDDLLQKIAHFYSVARSATRELAETISQSGVFSVDAPGARATPLCARGHKKLLVRDYDSAYAKIISLLNEANSTATPRMRLRIMERLLAMAEARQHEQKLGVLVQAAIASRPTESRLLAMLTTVDVLQNVFEDMSAVDAANFMLAYTGCLKGAADPLVVEALKKRFPRLHIFSVTDPQHYSERFPHHTNVDGGGVIHKETLLHIPIGFITSRLRERVRAEGRAKALAELRRREGEYVEALPPLAPEDVGDHTKDHGYRENEAVMLQYEGHMSHPESPLKRVRNNGWRVKAYELDPYHQFEQANPLRYFVQPPELRVRLVHAESRIPVLPDHPHGGLDPAIDLRTAKSKMTLCPPGGTPVNSFDPRYARWAVPHEYNLGPGRYTNPRDQFVRTKTYFGGCDAVVARFWPGCLSKQHAGQRFRIVVECTGRQKSDPYRTLTVTAETPPYTFQFDKKGGTRRKAPSPAPSPSLAQRPRRC